MVTDPRLMVKLPCIGTMWVPKHGERQTGHITCRRRIETVGPLHNVPSVIFTTAACSRLYIQLFKKILPHITYIEISGQPVKGETKRISQAICPYFRETASTDKGIARRNRICRSCGGYRFNIDAKHLVEQGILLPVAERISAAPAVTGPEV